MTININKRAFSLGFPVFISYIPSALAFGLLGKNSGFTLFETMIFPVFVLSGSAQFMAVNLYLSGTNLFGIYLTVFLMSFRFFLMSSALIDKLNASCKKYFSIMLPGITDESFTLISLQKGSVAPDFVLTIQIFGYLTWILSSATGYILGDVLPKEITLSLGLGIYALFLSMLVPQMKKSFGITVVVILSAIINSVIKYFNLLPNGWNIIIAILISSFIGSFLVDNIKSKEKKEANDA